MSDHAPASAFASCPAATGESRPPCKDFPDGAHRCSKERRHTCGYAWVSATINDGRMPPAPG